MSPTHPIWLSGGVTLKKKKTVFCVEMKIAGMETNVECCSKRKISFLVPYTITKFFY
jgi:hypothetical protein